MTSPSATSSTILTRPRRSSQGSSLTQRLLRRREGTAAWERPAFFGLLGIAAVLYVWNLSVSGWANSFYAAAVQAGTKSWEAFFYGSSDIANSITVDKPPMSLWFMEISARIFGFSSFSMLLPEALMGIATVGVLYATVRRHFSAPVALIAGAAMAFTPVAALMFRFNNPDALLLLLMTLSVYFTVRGIESGKIRWVLWAGTMIGFGFLTKEFQAFLILPALAIVYAFAAPTRLRTRLLHLLAALGAIIVSAGWWVAIVELTPASMRPYIGGSQTNSFLELTFGYNGFGRLTGNETGSVTGGTGTTTTTSGQWGATGILRLFGSEFAGQASWLLPAALVLVVAAIVMLWKRPRVDAKRALVLFFAGWMIVTWLTFSFAGGIFHAYYTVALAPAIAGSAAMGAGLLWERRGALWSRLLLAATVVGTAGWAYYTLTLSSSFLPWLKFVVLGAGIIAAALLMVPRLNRRLSAVAISVALIAALGGPTAYSIDTAMTSHTGSLPTAGPSVTSSMGGGMGGGGAPTGTKGGTAPTGTKGGTAPTGAKGGTMPTGTKGGTAPTGTRAGAAPTGSKSGAKAGGNSLISGTSVGTALKKLLETDASKYTWVAATTGSTSAASYQLATGYSVMPIGGFNGSDPSPTLAKFEAYVKAGKIHYYVAGSVGASNGGSSDSSKIAAWVKANFTSKTVDGVTVYDLTSSK
ncbi:MAG: glycosyl transferase [Frondihabitans sp.]|nr:glycosyl transferase [Frondihabitans sp.]